MEGQNSDILHDFFTEQKWLILLGGDMTFEKKTKKYYFYLIYKIYLLLIMLYLISIALTGAILDYGNIVSMLQGAHMSLVVMMCLFGSSLKQFLKGPLHASLRALRSGVFHYEGESLDIEHVHIMKQTVFKIRRLAMMFTRAMAIAIVAHMLLVPLVQMALGSEVPKDAAIHPYLPFAFYMPFETRNTFGFMAAYFMNILFVSFLFPTIVSIDHIHLSCALQLKAQYKILNYSLKNLERRAIERLIGAEGIKFSTNFEEYYPKKEFQDSLLLCLRENVKHHQALLRLNKTMGGYIGAMFFTIVILATGFLAFNLLSLLKVPPIHEIVCYLTSLFCEVLYSLHFCWYGEDMSAESSKVFYTLYYVSWYRYDTRVRKMLALIMCNSLRPVWFQTPAFGITASRHTFNTIITTMYQVVNVLVNSKFLQ